MSEAYLHRVHYYETDKMGIVHHSNYIRWMEEARVDFLDRLGAGFAAMEAAGVYSPVVAVSCRYHRPCRFDDRVRIRVTVSAFRGVRLQVAYEMFNETTGELAVTGASEHCFTDGSGRPILLNKYLPEADALLRAAVREAPAE